MTRSVRLPADLDLGAHPAARIEAALRVADPALVAAIEAEIVAGRPVGRPAGAKSRTPERRVRCVVCHRETAGCGPDGMNVRRHEVAGGWCPGGTRTGIAIATRAC